MQKLSKIYKGLAFREEISVAVLDTTALVSEAIKRHNLSPVAAAALGRTFTAAAYYCSWLKEKKSAVSITIAGGGPGGKICVSGDGALRMRGYVENSTLSLPLKPNGKLDVGGYVGNRGYLTLCRDDGEGLPFVGTSELISGEIAEDFSNYFLKSEQRPTAIALGVLIDQNSCLSAGGVFLQPLPNASEEAISFAEQSISAFSDVSKKIYFWGAEEIFRSFEAEIEEEREIVFRCRCSRSRARSALLAMGKEEAKSLLKERGEICVHCPDCNRDYLFREKEIEELFEDG